MTKSEFIYSFRDYLFEPATSDTLEAIKSLIFKYIESNSKLEFEDFDTTKLVLSLPDIEELFSPSHQTNYPIRDLITT